MTDPVVLLMFAFLLAVTIGIMRLHDLFAAVMLSGIYSLLSAGIFVVMDAVDVAFTEAAVGAGISTVLLIETLALTKRRETAGKRAVELIPLLTVLVVGGGLIYGTLDLPSYGDPGAPIHHYMAPRFIERSASEVGPPNIVTSVLASYRAYDTFGETTVIFTAAIGALLLLGRRFGVRPERAEEDHDEREND